MNHGSRPIRRDHRNYSFNRTFGTTVQLPDSYNADTGFGFPDQDADDLPYGCTGYTQSELCQDEDTVQYDPAFTYQKTLMMEGNSGQQVGCSIEDSLKSTVVYGVLGKDEEADTEAQQHRRGQYFQIEQVGTDMFDAIRQALYINRDERRSVSCGTPWFHEWAFALAGILHDFVFTGNEPWHNYKICGWKQISGQPYLICKSWQGSQYGDGGWCYMSRTICNKVFSLSGSGAFTVRKATAADVQTVKLDIISTILSYFRMWLSNLMTTQSTTPPEAQKQPVQPVPPPVAPTVPSTVPESVSPNPDALLPWDTSESLSHANFHNVRAICDLEGLTFQQKDELCATVWAESDFNTHALRHNYARRADGTSYLASTDFGICQWNDFYHGKEITPDDATNDPEKAVRLMCEYWKLGRESQWVAYSTGAYKARLGATL